MGLWPLDFYFHRIKKKSKETSMIQSYIFFPRHNLSFSSNLNQIVLVNAMPQAGFFLLFK
jgi:hypothetical protein